MAAKKKKQGAPLGGPGHKLISKNRKAARNYELGERFEAGLVLVGTEVKSCRAGKAHVNDAWVLIKGGEAFLVGSHIAAYSHGGPHLNHEPERTRKLLLHGREIDKLTRHIQERGFVAVPTSMYFKHGYVKVEIALAKGRTHSDKRDRVKERDTQREIQRALRRGRR